LERRFLITGADPRGPTPISGALSVPDSSFASVPSSGASPSTIRDQYLSPRICPILPSARLYPLRWEMPPPRLRDAPGILVFYK
jgi:hypothetical protein